MRRYLHYEIHTILDDHREVHDHPGYAELRHASQSTTSD